MITARRLGKRYGEKRVLREVDLDAAARRLRSSSPARTAPGKTTLLRLCAGLAAADRGRARASTRRAPQIGYLGHEPLVYRELTALENLDLYGRLYRVPERRERIGMLLERFGLWDVRARARRRRTRAA